MHSGSVFTNHSLERSLSYSPDFSIFRSIWMKHNFWLAKPYGLANQKLCYIQLQILKKKTKNVLENSWWIRTLILVFLSALRIITNFCFPSFISVNTFRFLFLFFHSVCTDLLKIYIIIIIIKPQTFIETRRNPLPHNATFRRTIGIKLWKALWEKEKLLVTSNFSFSHNVSYPICHLFFILNAL